MKRRQFTKTLAAIPLLGVVPFVKADMLQPKIMELWTVWRHDVQYQYIYAAVAHKQTLWYATFRCDGDIVGPRLACSTTQREAAYWLNKQFERRGIWTNIQARDIKALVA